MDTSKLNKEHTHSVAGAFIFSGLPDPVWQVEDDVVVKLEGIWDKLKPFTGGLPSTQPLGYKGCFLKCKENLEWFSYNGVVTKRTLDGHEHRMDENRIFEKLLLESAPEGMLPEKIF